MSSTGVALSSKRRGRGPLKGEVASLGSVGEILTYLAEKPLAAMIALWTICLPLLYFALYGDLVESARTLAGMTVIVLVYLFIFITVLLSASFLIAYLLRIRERRKYGLGERKT
jgi:hypothetical protein